MVVSSGGEVITNNHVIEGATTIEVLTWQRPDLQRDRRRLCDVPRTWRCCS